MWSFVQIDWVEKKIKADFWINTFFPFYYYLPFRNGVAILWAKFGCQVILDWPSGSWEEKFYILSIYFRNFIIMSSWKWAWPFIWTNLNPLYTRMLYAKCGEISVVVLQKYKYRYLNFVNVFSLFRKYLPFEKGGDLHMKKLVSSLPKDALCQIWLKLVWWFLRSRWKCNKRPMGHIAHLRKIFTCFQYHFTN